MGKDSKNKKRIIVSSIITAVIFCGILAVLLLWSNNSLNLGQPKDDQNTIETDDSSAQNPETDEDEQDAEVDDITPEEAYENFEIREVVDVADSHAMTETEVVAFLRERGFDNAELTTNYDADGTYHESTVITGGSENKHPIYSAPYITQSGNEWMLTIENDQIVAAPLFYNLNNSKVMIFISEKETITSYYSPDNSYYVVIPDENEAVIKRIERIDANALEELDTNKLRQL